MFQNQRSSPASMGNNFCEDDDVAVCPYNRFHVVLAHRLGNHIFKAHRNEHYAARYLQERQQQQKQQQKQQEEKQQQQQEAIQRQEAIWQRNWENIDCSPLSPPEENWDDKEDCSPDENWDDEDCSRDENWDDVSVGTYVPKLNSNMLLTQTARNCYNAIHK